MKLLISELPVGSLTLKKRLVMLLMMKRERLVSPVSEHRSLAEMAVL